MCMGLRAHRGSWAPADDPHTPEDAARVVPWDSPRPPGGWTAVVRRFRDGHRETWWAADLRLAGMAPRQALRLVAVTTDPARLPADSTWYLLTNLPHPDAPHAATSPIAPADLAEVARLYGLRTWVEQGYKQMQQELGWADWQVRTRPRHPAALGARLRRLLLLLVGLEPRPGRDRAAQRHATARPTGAGSQPRAGEKRGRRRRSAPTGRTCPGRWRCGGCRRGSTPGPCSGAGGAPGRRCPRPRRYRRSLTGSGSAIRSTASSDDNKLPTSAGR